MANRKLQPDQIVEAALACLDEHGLDKLSMRRLGSALGVEAMSLYNHFRNKGEILDAIHGRLLNEMPVPGLVGSWQDSVRSAAAAFRKLLEAHPKAIPLLASRAAVKPASLAYFSGGVEVFRAAGLQPLDSVRAFQSTFALVIGHAAFHFSRLGEEPQDIGAVYAEYPTLATVSSLGQFDAVGEFNFGVEALIAGIERLTEKVAASRPRRPSRRRE